MEVKQKSLKKNAFLNVVKTLMGLLFPLITFPYASRILLPDGIGKVNFAQTIVSYFSIIAMLGINTYGIREASKLRDDKIKLSQFVKELFTINMIATVFAYCLFAVSLFAIPKFSEYRILLCVCSATILFTTLGMEWLYTAMEDFAYITIRSIVFQVISLILLFTLVHTKDDYLKYAGISVFSNVGANILNFVHSRKYLSFKELAKSELKKHWKPIFVIFASVISTSIYLQLDVTMVGVICGEREVGLYTTANKIVRIAISIVTSLGAVMLPRLSNNLANGDFDSYRKNLKNSFLFTLIVGGFGIIGILLFSDLIISIFAGKEFSESAFSMRLLSPIILIVGFAHFVGFQILYTNKQEKVYTIAVTIAAVMNFFSNLFFIPIFKQNGAVLGTIIAESVGLFVMSVLGRKWILEVVKEI